MTLEEYQKAFKKGDSQPLATIFKEHGKYCMENLQHKTQCSEDDAKDAFIEAIMIFRDRTITGKLTELSSLRNYLYAICINKQKENWASDLRKLNHEDRIKKYFYEMTDDPQYEMASEDYKQELFTKCLHLLQDLGDKCVELLRAFYVRNESAEEIMEEMGFVSIAVTRSSKSRCLKKWRERVHEAMNKG